jgi:hypothetical protein
MQEATAAIDRLFSHSLRERVGQSAITNEGLDRTSEMERSHRKHGSKRT